MDLRSVWRVLCVLLAVFGVIIPSLLLFITVQVDSYGGETEDTLLRSPSTHERKPLDYLPDSKDVSELKLQIQELEEIRASVRDELRVFEQQRTKLGNDISSHKDNLAKVKKDLTTAKIELHDTRGKLSKATREFYDKVDPVPAPVVNAAPIIVLPAENKMSSLTELKDPLGDKAKDGDFVLCAFPLCFRYASCPLTQPFKVYVYSDINAHMFPIHYDSLVSEFVAGLKATNSLTSSPDTACVFVAILDNSNGVGNALDVEAKIHSLAHWKEGGANHVLIELSSSRDGSSMLEGVQTGRAIVARSVISPTKPFRSGYDILLPPLLTAQVNWRDLPTMLPAFRENLIYFQGNYQPLRPPSSSSIIPTDLKALQKALEGRDRVHIELQCPGSDNGMLENVREGEWALCGEQTSRLALCSQSTFSLVPSPGGVRNGLGTATYTRLIESLMCGSIPVLIGITTLPFDDVIDWQRAAITVPPGRFSDVHYILRSIDQDTVLDFRLRGRNLWQIYFSSPLTVVQSAVAIVRYRTLHPPPLAPDFIGAALHSHRGGRKRLISPVLTQNFTVYTQEFWNNPPGPFFTYPTTPFKAGPPLSGYQFIDLDERALARLPLHIVDGGGITGPNFEDLLLGNSPEEQFTVVMLTYQRNQVLLEALERLKEVSFLNKVIVVWNNEEAPPPEMEWPDIMVPIEVVCVCVCVCVCVILLPLSLIPSLPPLSSLLPTRWCVVKETASTIVSCHSRR